MIKTYFIFTDLPVHLEYRVHDLPLMQEKTIINFNISLKHPKDPTRIRAVNGEYTVSRNKLMYSSDGLVQYLELSPKN
jgi:hypothetical protein